MGLSGGRKIQKMHLKGRLKLFVTNFLWLTNYIEDRETNKGEKMEERQK